jgi:hypothetical protein
MAARARQSYLGFGAITYSIGLALIFAAVIFNLSLHKLSLQHLYLLPDFLVEPYEQAGPMGVTLFFAGLGVFVIIVGFLHGAIRGHATVDLPEQPEVEPEGSGKGSSQKIAVEASGNGVMVLDTAKYLGRKPVRRADHR